MFEIKGLLNTQAATALKPNSKTVQTESETIKMVNADSQKVEKQADQVIRELLYAYDTMSSKDYECYSRELLKTVPNEVKAVAIEKFNKFVEYVRENVAQRKEEDTVDTYPKPKLSDDMKKIIMQKVSQSETAKTMLLKSGIEIKSDNTMNKRLFDRK